MHTESRDSQVFTRSFGFGGFKGPVAKSIRNNHQKDIFPDQGLYKNAEAIKYTLERLLHQILFEGLKLVSDKIKRDA